MPGYTTTGTLIVFAVIGLVVAVHIWREERRAKRLALQRAKRSGE